MYFVWGLGVSGWYVAEYLYQQKMAFHVWDDHPDVQKRAIAKGWILQKSPLGVAYTAAIVAPGLGLHPLTQALIQYGYTILSDVAFFAQCFPHVVSGWSVGITGSNGKSSVCSLVKCGMDNAGIPNLLIGNIGKGVFAYVTQGHPVEEHWHIIECSSYQLDWAPHLPLRLGVILNLTPHHLERHKTMTAYLRAKVNVLRYASMRLIPRSLVSQVQEIFAEWQQPGPCTTDPSWHIVEDADNMPTHALAMNEVWASAILRILHMPVDVSNYHPLPHRQQHIAMQQGVLYINDSKATNPMAARCALQDIGQKFPKVPLYWLAGGEIQEDDLMLFQPACHYVKEAFVFGRAAQRYYSALTSMGCHVHNDMTLSQSFAHAQERALTYVHHHALAHNDGETDDASQIKAVILLSPGCASFDAFENFQQRGLYFQDLVQRSLQTAH